MILVITFAMSLAVTAQLKSAIIPASNQVARDQALVRSVQGLERDNQALRQDVRASTRDIDSSAIGPNWSERSSSCW